MNKKTCIIIGGPTAAGKTDLAIRLALHFKTQIISADSRQCYREMNIGVAKPSPAELSLVKHYFINSHSISENLNAALFEEYALNAAGEIFKENDIAILAGGTGLYIKAFCSGLDPMPSVDNELREQITRTYGEKGIGWLQETLKQQDPEYFSKGDISNPQRLMRALEMVMASGRSILSFQKNAEKSREFNIIKIAITLPREQLYERINSRVDSMMHIGFLEEVQGLLPWKNLNALQTVGYRELFAFLNGNLTKAEAIEAIKQNTRHYAKRQLTWFRKDLSFNWFSPSDDRQIIDLIQAHLYNFGIPLS